MRFLSLPNEVILLIGENIASEADLNSLIRVNSRLHNILIGHIYRYNSNVCHSSALLWAAEHGQESTARKSLDAGSNVETVNEQDQTPLSLAAAQGHVPLVRLLLTYRDIDVNSRDENDQTPLSHAAEHGHEEVIKLLLARDSVDINARDCDGRTPLLVAAMQGFESIVRLLLQCNGIDINMRDEDGRTPLIAAAMFRRRKVANCLLQHADIDIKAQDCEGLTALWWARQYGYEFERKGL
ncbi:ankyrin repeat-containing [Fusarium albosuccineum]|uniref:Ankyrin repeat-containing n=1 Tax=Fusarium albosuccineum TaxID=1237068 RepID=A0A8H4LFW3_9HYPO|nr:ankyrin repeat-containing [Fusarium albosuccineum]